MVANTLSPNGDSNMVVQVTENKRAVGMTFEDLYKRYYGRVYSICLRMTANRADAEDLTHDTLLQVQRNLAGFRGESAFTSWLHQVATNQVLMHFRKKSTRTERTTDNGEIPEPVEPFTARQQAMPIIDRIALASAIEKLPPGYRSVFLLHDVEGYEHEEVARILGFSPGTSKSQLHKARMRLRAILREHGPKILTTAQPVAATKDKTTKGTKSTKIGSLLRVPS